MSAPFCFSLPAAQGDSPKEQPGSISRADVAAVCVEALGNPDAKNKTFELMARERPQKQQMPKDEYFRSISQIFSGLQKD
jgi:hypothetical protein